MTPHCDKKRSFFGWIGRACHGLGEFGVEGQQRATMQCIGKKADGIVGFLDKAGVDLRVVRDGGRRLNRFRWFCHASPRLWRRLASRRILRLIPDQRLAAMLRFL